MCKVQDPKAHSQIGSRHLDELAPFQQWRDSETEIIKLKSLPYQTYCISETEINKHKSALPYILYFRVRVQQT